MGFGITLNVEAIEDKKIVELDGRIDATTAPILEKKLEALVAPDSCRFALDFSKVEYLSSAGLRVLLAISKKTHHLGGKVVLYSLTEDVMEIIRMGGFKSVLAICSNREDALKSF